MDVRRLTSDDATQAWEFRLEALEREPMAFGQSVREHQMIPVSDIEERLRTGGDDEWTLGAFEHDRLIGVVRFARATADKRRHKGFVLSMYVAPDHRGKGVGRALVLALVGEARRLPGLTQLLLDVSANQDAAKSLYASVGFETYGTEPAALQVAGERIDQHLMILRLS